MQNLIRADLQDSQIRVESGAMYYMIGQTEIESPSSGGIGGIFKSMATGENIMKPIIKGTGEVWLEPTYGDFHFLELDNEEWVLDKGAYYASEAAIETGVFTNKAISGLMGGEGFFQTKVSGTGVVAIKVPGPLETIELNNSRLVVDGSFAVARTGAVEFKVEKATKSLLGSLKSGEGLVNTFEGTGKVLIAPAPTFNENLMGSLGAFAALSAA